MADYEHGSFTQLALLLRSGTLPGGAVLGEIWASIPSLPGAPLGGETKGYLAPLRFAPHTIMGLHGIRQTAECWVHGLPADLGTTDDDASEVGKLLARYPALADSEPTQLVPYVLASDTWPAGAIRSMRSWSLADNITGTPEEFLRDFADRRSMPYLGDDDRWVFPALGGSDLPLHPALAWWALLLTLSMLARYEPADWTQHLDVDRRPTAVKLASALSLAHDVCPQLILHAIRAVGGV